MADFEVLGVIRVDDQGIHVLDGLTSKLGGINQMAERSSGLMSHLGQSVDYMVGNLMTNAFNAVTGAVSNFVSGSFEMNASLEKSTLQFTTLLGNSTAAKEHIAMLYKFAAETPFETGPIIQASKSLLTFGGTALDTEKNIRMVGDAAAAVNQPINEVAFWTGRAYSMIQGGKPFGEAAMRLQEMGLLTAQGREQLEKLQKSGADATTVFGAFQSQMGRFDGAMKAQAGTWEGLMSTIKDNVNMVSAQAFKPLFDLVKGGQGILSNFVQSADFTQIAANIAAPLERITAPLTSFLTSFGTMDPKMRTVGNAIGLFAISFRDVFGTDTTARLMSFGNSVDKVVNAFTVGAGPEGDFINGIANVFQLLGMGIPAFADLGDALTNVETAFQDSIPTIRKAAVEAWEFVLKTVQTIAPGILKSVSTLLNTIGNFWRAHGTEVIAVVSFLWRVLVVTVGGAIQLIINVVSAGVAFITGAWNTMSLILKGNWQGAWDSMHATATAVWNALSTGWEGFLNAVLAIVGTNLTSFNAMWQNNLNMLITIVTTVMNNVITTIRSFFSKFFQVGYEIVNGIKAGFSNAWNSFESWISSLVGNLIDRVKAMFGIKSPSSVFAEIGRMNMIGLAQGMSDMSRLPVSTARSMATQMTANSTHYNTQNYNLTVHSSSPIEPIIQDFTMLRSMSSLT